uniref:Reverse transcriptase domain-containing protein n=1 Tax=Rhabditophanes sp. KR3021 TaxID=114890 RepID=A0AC35U1X2_9BILA
MMALRHFGVEEYYVEAIKELYDNSKLTFSRLGNEVIIPSAADVKQGDCPSPRLFTLLTTIKELYDNSKLTFSRLGNEVIIPSAADVKQGDCPSPRLFTLLTSKRH